MDNFGIKILGILFNCIMKMEQMPSAWRKSILIPIFNRKGNIKECTHYRGIKLLSYAFKIWERVVHKMTIQCADRPYVKVSFGSSHVARKMRFSY